MMHRLPPRVRGWVTVALRAVYVLYLAARDKRVPMLARAVALACAAYVLAPINLIPNEIPAIGELDDALVVAIGIVVVRRAIPAPLLAELWAKAAERFADAESVPAHDDLAQGLVFALAAAIASRILVYAVGYAAHRVAGDGVSMVQAFCQWDCSWYVSIMRDGYASEPPDLSTGAVNWAFFPLLPLLARLVWILLPGSPEQALLITGNLAFLAAAMAIYCYGREQFGEAFARTLVLITAFNPYSIYFSAGYTEPLFLLATTLAFMLWARERFLLAGLAAAAASASRIVGALLVLPFAISALQDGILRRLRRFHERELRMLNAILLVPLGLALFMAYLYLRTGDALATIDAQVAGWDMVPGNPFSVLLRAWQSPETVLKYFAAVTTLGFGLALYLAIRKRFGEAAFMLAGILVPLSAMPWSMPRYIFGLLPTYVALTLLTRELRLPLSLIVGVLAVLNVVVVVVWVGGPEWAASGPRWAVAFEALM